MLIRDVVSILMAYSARNFSATGWKNVYQGRRRWHSKLQRSFGRRQWLSVCWAGDVGRRGRKACRISGDSCGTDDTGSNIGGGNCSGAWMAGKEEGEGDGDKGIGGGGSGDTVGTGESWSSVSSSPSLSSSASHRHFIAFLVHFAGGGVAVGDEGAVGASSP